MQEKKGVFGLGEPYCVGDISAPWRMSPVVMMGKGKEDRGWQKRDDWDLGEAGAVWGLCSPGAAPDVQARGTAGFWRAGTSLPSSWGLSALAILCGAGCKIRLHSEGAWSKMGRDHIPQTRTLVSWSLILHMSISVILLTLKWGWHSERSWGRILSAMSFTQPQLGSSFKKWLL